MKKIHDFSFQIISRLPSISGLARRKITSEFLKTICRNADEKLSVLDIGSGIRNWSFVFSADDLVKYDTVELDRELEATYRGDFTQLEFDTYYDLVIATEFIEHISDPRSFFKKVHSVLSDSGVLLISFPFLFKIHANPDDYFRYTESGVRAVSSEYFEVDRVHAHGGKFQAAWEILIDGKALYPLRLLNPLFASVRHTNTNFPLGYVVVLRPRSLD